MLVRYFKTLFKRVVLLQFIENTIIGENLLDRQMYDKWFVSPFFFPPKKKEREQKENKLAIPVLNIFF